MKTKLRWILAFTIALSLGAFAATNAPVTSFTLKGTVVDAAGQPVAGATIEATEWRESVPFGDAGLAATRRVETGAKGDFELSLPRRGALVVARKPGLAPTWRQLWNVEADTELRLVLTPPTVLAGVVVDEADKPVPNAEVFVAAARSAVTVGDDQPGHGLFGGKPAREMFSTRTGTDGRFRIEGFPTNASAHLEAKATGKALRSPEGQPSLSPEILQWQAGQQDIKLVMEPAGNIEGRIVREDGGAPLPVARLHLLPDRPVFALHTAEAPVESRADGTFRIPEVPAGNYRLRATFGTNALPDWVADTVPVSVEAGQVTRDVNITAVRGGMLRVTTLGKTSRVPRAETSLMVFRQDYQAEATSDSNGVAWLRLPPGQYQVYPNVQGRQWQPGTANIEAGRTNQVELEVPEPVKLRGAVRGPDDKPAAGVEVRIVSAPGGPGPNVKTDAEGRFEMEWTPLQLPGMSVGNCLLVRDPGRNLAAAQDVDEDAGPVELRLAPALTLAGRVECAGKPVTNATATLLFWTGRSGIYLQGLAVGTNTPGQFEIPALPPGRRYGVMVSAPGYGQVVIHEVESDEAKRVELDPVELKPANLKVAGRVLDADDKPVAGAYVNLYGEGQPSASTRTDREGRFAFDRVCEGTVRVSASSQASFGNTVAEGGDTNVVLHLGQSVGYSPGSATRKLQGRVTDSEGKPVAGAQVVVFPFSESRRKTDTNGAFNLSFTIQPWQVRSGGDPCLVVRDPARNLAAAEDLSEGVTNVTIQLKPAVTLTGRVEGPDGVALTNAEVGVWLLACRTYSQLDEQPTRTDSEGRFEIKTLPAGPNYRMSARAKDHGQHAEEIEVETGTNRVVLPTFVLKRADKVIAGQLVDEKDRPVAGADVRISGNDQPESSATTDKEGRFRLQACEGPAHLFATKADGYANASVEGGDTNVVLQLSERGGSIREAPARTALTGKPLPALAGVGLAADALPAGKPLLLCLFDAEQRPSRRLVRLLAEQHGALTQKGLAVAAVQAATASDEAFKAWKEAGPPPFPLGRVTEKTTQNRWATEVTSLPWLILADAAGKVVAEGFALEELDAKLATLKK